LILEEKKLIHPFYLLELESDMAILKKKHYKGVKVKSLKGYSFE
jgi:hypothetical protein